MKKKSKFLQRIKNDFIYVVVRATMAVGRLIPLSLGLIIGAAIGSATWRLLGYERNCSMINLKVAFPDWNDEKRAQVGREAFRNLGRSFFEILHFKELIESLKGPDPYVRFVGFEHLDRALEQGRGVVLIAAHTGNWELMAGSAVAHGGYPGNEIVRKLYDKRIDKLLNDHRRHFDYKPLTRGGADLIADITEVFAKNEILALLMDQDTKVRGVFADFFGHPAWTPSGPAFLCYMADFDALSLTIYRNPDKGHTVTIGSPIPRPQTGDQKTDVAAYTQLMNDRICEHIREHPTEWVWMHRRWETRPEGEAPENHPTPRPRKPYRY